MPPLSRGTVTLWRSRTPLRVSPRFCRQSSSIRNHFFEVAEEVQEALQTGKPVVALETTIYTHGFPYPENVALSSHLESLVRVNGGIPATIGILNGVARVGMQPEELIELVSTAGSAETWKISRRDLGFIAGLGLVGKKINGGTTIAGTMILAQLAGIKILATGGLGGVHRGGEISMDISADLTELGRTPVTVISSGCKSFLDIPRTLEYLETQGVGVGTFADGRKGAVDFPAFFSRDSGVRSPKVILDEAEAAAIVFAQSKFPLSSGLLFANPVPEKAAIAKDEMDIIIKEAIDLADAEGIHGAANTPFILNRIRDSSQGRSVVANRALVEANVIRGTKVALELAKLELREKGVLERPPPSVSALSVSSNPAQSQFTGTLSAVERSTNTVEILVAGALASDIICDFQPLPGLDKSNSPAFHTSNPATFSHLAGGVGYNVALAAHYAGASVFLSSVVANDISGLSLVAQVGETGLPIGGIRQLGRTTGVRTAQYIAMNDAQKDLVLAMSDFSILSAPQLESREEWSSIIDNQNPSWIAVDGNWAPPILSAIFSSAKGKSLVAFEPVSVQKASRLFHSGSKIISQQAVFPNNVVDLMTPNAFELETMHHTARQALLFESDPWWRLINSLNMPLSGSRDRLTAICNAELVDRGIPQQAIQLIPFIPCIITKLGPQGCLLSQLLLRGDPRLRNPEYAPYILGRTSTEDDNDYNKNDNSDLGASVGGLYMRLFPPTAAVAQEEIVSVNGVGDTMLGVLMAGLSKANRTVADIIPLAQRAAVMTLKSPAAVSPDVKTIETALSGLGEMALQREPDWRLERRGRRSILVR